MRRLDLFGKATPVTVTSWSLFAVGVLLALGSRFGGAPGWWLGAGLIAIGASMLVDLLPGGSEMTDQQLALVRHIGFSRPRRTHKVASLLIGALFAGCGAWLLWG